MHGQRPQRYDQPWLEPFHQRIDPIASRPGVRILELGSGRMPAIGPESRSPGCWYAGLDVSAEELARAPSGAYQETIVADATVFQPQLRSQFDLILSWQVLEHVRPLHQVLAHAKTYLRPNGRLVALFSGRFSLFAILNRAIPHWLGAHAVHRKMGRSPDEIFPAFYDGCYHSALARMLDGWSQYEIVPIHRAAVYFDFLRLTEAICIAYEEWALLGSHPNLASHYLISASP